MDSFASGESYEQKTFSNCLYEQKRFSPFLSVVLVTFIPFQNYLLKKVTGAWLTCSMKSKGLESRNRAIQEL